MSIVPGRKLELPDGRVVRTLEAGVPRATPILLFHPTPSSRLFVRQHADAALRTGTRLVGFSRPGSGGSSPAAPGLRVVAEDAVRVADSYGLDSFAVLGFSGGTPFAAATAALFPDRVHAVGLCGSVAPLPIGEDLPAEERHLADLLELADDALVRALMAEVGPDDEPYLDQVLAASQALTLRDALEDENGHPDFGGLRFDYAAFAPPWDVDVSAVRAPTWVWQGTADPITPLEHGQWYADNLVTVTLVPREGAGHLGAFEAHRDEMLSILRDTR